MPVSLIEAGRQRPTISADCTTSSKGTTDLIPAIAISAHIIEFTTPDEFLKVHGYSTSPATGSQTSPITFKKANDAACKICYTLPPVIGTKADDAMAAAEPHSA